MDFVGAATPPSGALHAERGGPGSDGAGPNPAVTAGRTGQLHARGPGYNPPRPGRPAAPRPGAAARLRWPEGPPSGDRSNVLQARALKRPRGEPQGPSPGISAQARTALRRPCRPRAPRAGRAGPPGRWARSRCPASPRSSCRGAADPPLGGGRGWLRPANRGTTDGSPLPPREGRPGCWGKCQTVCKHTLRSVGFPQSDSNVNILIVVRCRLPRYVSGETISEPKHIWSITLEPRLL